MTYWLITVEIEVLVGMGWLAVYRSWELASRISCNKYVQKAEFIIMFLFFSKLYVTINLVQMLMKFLYVIFADNNESIIDISTPQLDWMGESSYSISFNMFHD